MLLITSWHFSRWWCKIKPVSIASYRKVKSWGTTIPSRSSSWKCVMGKWKAPTYLALKNPLALPENSTTRMRKLGTERPRQWTSELDDLALRSTVESSTREFSKGTLGYLTDMDLPDSVEPGRQFASNLRTFVAPGPTPEVEVGTSTGKERQLMRSIANTASRKWTTKH